MKIRTRLVLGLLGPALAVGWACRFEGAGAAAMATAPTAATLDRTSIAETAASVQLALRMALTIAYLHVRDGGIRIPVNPVPVAEPAWASRG